MERRTVLVSALLALGACQGTESTRPEEGPSAPPSLLISDGAHSGGNPDFFFLTPMVPNPGQRPGYGDPFNGDLQPTVKVCALNATTEAAAPAAACKSSGYSLTTAVSGPNGNHYQLHWSVPNSSDIFYRIEVFVGLIRLGFAEVKTAANNSGLNGVNPNLFVALKDGSNLPIKFRIEQNALCQGVTTCTSKTINLAAGGVVTTDLTGATGTSGVDIPSQGTGPTVTITVAPCEDLNPRVTDLRTFGPCLSLTSTPPLPAGGLVNAGTAFVCEITPFIPAGMDHEQQERITLHQFDAPNTLLALPHAAACGTSVGASNSVKGIFASLRRGAFRSAGRQLAAMFSPRPLHASMIDVGAGGRFRSFSDFQFALPSKLEIVEGNGQTAFISTAVAIDPKVIVTDLGGLPVEGARVRFAATSVTCATAAGTNSAVDGTVSYGTWTLAATPGTNNLTACGRGIAGTDFNGPRTGVDPFQPIQDHFDLGTPPEPPGGPVQEPVVTGSVTFIATGTADPVDVVPFGTNGYTTYGPFAGFGTPPTNWPVPAANVAPDVGSDSPFGGNDPETCDITDGFPSTTFPVNSDIFVTKAFTTPYAGTLTITVQIDNDAKVYLDGVEITSQGVGGSQSAYNASTNYNGVLGWWIHDNCADMNAPVFTITGVGAGPHSLSIWAHDRGTVGYLDAKVHLSPPIP